MGNTVWHNFNVIETYFYQRRPYTRCQFDLWLECHDPPLRTNSAPKPPGISTSVCANVNCQVTRRELLTGPRNLMAISPLT
jgi:hypothetical protein